MKLEVRTADRDVVAFALEDGERRVLGAGADAECRVEAEPFLSRRHAVLTRIGDRLEVAKIPEAKNAVLYKGSIAEKFRMKAGDFFVIGKTTFYFLDTQESARRSALAATLVRDDQPMFQYTMPVEELKERGAAGDRMRLLDLLELPDVLRRQSRGEFYLYACEALRMAAGADWVQVVTVDGDKTTVLAQGAARDDQTDRPLSRALIDASLRDAPQPVACSWSRGHGTTLEATQHEGIDWAVSCAAPIPGEQPIIFYLAGRSGRSGGGFAAAAGERMGLRDSARLVGLVADMIGRALATQKLEAWKSRLGTFFSGKLFSKILEAEGLDALAPKIVEATVMFFDIRGFSALTEGNLKRILEYEGELRRALTAMTQCVMDHDGMVLRYMGDGFLACWNTPYPVENHVERACLAATEMVDRLKDVTDGWDCGIGIGIGDVVAGALGSDHMSAYDLLGAVANQTSRVEGITKAVGVPILVTEEVVRRLNPDRMLSRRVARFLPLGNTIEVDLYTVHRTPPDAEERARLEARFARHGEALVAFERGDWESAFDILHDIVREDAASRFVYTLAIQRKPPRDWRGVVIMGSK